jgi:hypothetical protein
LALPRDWPNPADLHEQINIACRMMIEGYAFEPGELVVEGGRRAARLPVENRAGRVWAMRARSPAVRF